MKVAEHNKLQKAQKLFPWTLTSDINFRGKCFISIIGTVPSTFAFHLIILSGYLTGMTAACFIHKDLLHDWGSVYVYGFFFIDWAHSCTKTGISNMSPPIFQASNVETFTDNFSQTFMIYFSIQSDFVVHCKWAWDKFLRHQNKKTQKIHFF